jgi:hypothetical protein
MVDYAVDLSVPPVRQRDEPTIPARGTAAEEPVKIERVQVGIATDDGQRALVTLPAMIKHCRKERVEDLLEDLTLICEDVQSARQGTSSSVPLPQSAP